MAPKTRDKNDGNAIQNDSNDCGSSYFQKTVKNFYFIPPPEIKTLSQWRTFSFSPDIKFHFF